MKKQKEEAKRKAEEEEQERRAHSLEIDTFWKEQRDYVWEEETLNQRLTRMQEEDKELERQLAKSKAAIEEHEANYLQKL